MTNNPYNELPHPVFLRYVAQNDYMIDGYYLPEGARLNAVADAIEHIEALLREAKREHDEARREICEFAVGWQRAGMRVQHPQQYAHERGWDCYKEESK